MAASLGGRSQHMKLEPNELGLGELTSTNHPKWAVYMYHLHTRYSIFLAFEAGGLYNNHPIGNIYVVYTANWVIYISPIPPIKGTIETTMGKSSMRNRQDLEPGSPFSPLRRQESSPAMFGRRCSKGAGQRIKEEGPTFNGDRYC